MNMSAVSRTIVVIAGFILITGCARHVTTSATPASASSIVAGLPASVTQQMVQEGDSIFNHGSCQRCHGMNGTKGRTGPDLTDKTWLHIDGSYNSIVGLINTGVPAAEFKSPTSRFPMRPRGGMPLTDAQVQDVAAYVFTLSHH